MNNKERVYIFGHRKPDTDSVCSTIALAYLKQQQGINAKPRILSSINRETKFVLDYFNVDVPKYLNDVRLQIRDVNFKRGFFINQNESINNCFKILEEASVNGIPVVDDDNFLQGIITTKDILCNVFSDNYISLDTSYSNILSVLEAKEVLKFDDEINGKVLLKACIDENSGANNNKADILIVDDKKYLVEDIIRCNPKLIILINNVDIDQEYISELQGKRINVIKTDFDFYKVSKTIGFSNYIKSIMTVDPVSFDLKSYVSDFNDTNNKAKFINYPVIDKNKKCVGMIRMFDIDKKTRKKVILVDHNQKAQSAVGLDEAEIIEVIDHHNLGGDLSTSSPISFRNMTVGSTCTIIYNMYLENSISIPRDIAGLMLSGILSDTLILRSPTTTDLDIRIVKMLSNALNINYEEYGLEMFKAGSSLVGRSIEDIIFEDFKTYTISDNMIGIGQVYTTNFEEISSSIDKYIEVINRVSINNNYLITAVFVTDIIRNGSYIIFNSKARGYLSDSFDIENIEQGHYFDGFVSRKKQMLPPILEVLEKK